jgi:hypothetical protein
VCEGRQARRWQHIKTCLRKQTKGWGEGERLAQNSAEHQVVPLRCSTSHTCLAETTTTETPQLKHNCDKVDEACFYHSFHLLPRIVFAWTLLTELRDMEAFAKCPFERQMANITIRVFTFTYGGRQERNLTIDYTFCEQFPSLLRPMRIR